MSVGMDEGAAQDTGQLTAAVDAAMLAAGLVRYDGGRLNGDLMLGSVYTVPDPCTIRPFGVPAAAVMLSPAEGPPVLVCRIVFVTPYVDPTVRAIRVTDWRNELWRWDAPEVLILFTCDVPGLGAVAAQVAVVLGDPEALAVQAGLTARPRRSWWDLLDYP